MEKVSLEATVDKIVKDIQKARNSQPQRDAHRNRLDELKRAKMTFEQNSSSAKNGDPQASAISDELYLPTKCFTCKEQVQPGKLLSCTVCQAIAQTKSENPSGVSTVQTFVTTKDT